MGPDTEYKAPEDDPVNHPKHYLSTGVQCPECGHGLETIDIIESQGYRVGNALKYVFRHKDKGNPVQDLSKAIWYLQREIQNLKRETNESE